MCCASLLETVTEQSADAVLLVQIKQSQIGLEGTSVMRKLKVAGGPASASLTGLEGAPSKLRLGGGVPRSQTTLGSGEQTHRVPLKHFQQSGQNHYLTFSCYHRQPKLGTPAPRNLFIRALETVRQQYELFVYGRAARPKRRPQISRVPRPSFAWAGVFLGHRPPRAPGADSWSTAEAFPAIGSKPLPFFQLLSPPVKTPHTRATGSPHQRSGDGAPAI